jgi:ribulose-phosphate 3-epimerase
MNQIVPTITATNAQEYREQMARISSFAKRVHIDFCDGQFAPVRLVNPIQAYWPDGVVADLHLMLVNPLEQLETVISLRPDLAIVQAESQGDLLAMMRQLKAVGIKAGVAFLQQTDPAPYAPLIAEADHVLIFSGILGHQGGSTADMSLLNKVASVRAINATVEVAWDGGVNVSNASQLVFGGVEVLNVGGEIQHAEDPAKAYDELVHAQSVVASAE